MADQGEKVELAARLDSARARLDRNVDALRRDLDVGSHLRHSFHENKAAFIGGATMLGLVLSKLPVRRKKVFVDSKTKGAIKGAEKAGVLILVLQFLFKTFQPMLTSLISRQVTDFVKRQGHSGE